VHPARADQLHAVPDVIAMAGGAAKALRAMFAGGYASSVVVDASLATAMLAWRPASPQRPSFATLWWRHAGRVAPQRRKRRV
jgi:hypothetical protein